MASAAVLQSRISAILEVLIKTAAAEISQLVQDDSVVLHMEIKRRGDELEGLKKRLEVTERELKEAQAAVLSHAKRCSVGVQVEMVDADVSANEKESSDGHETHVQAFNMITLQELKEEKPQPSHKVETPSEVLHEMANNSHTYPSETKNQAQDGSADEFGGLELEMKIEQVEELVDQELRTDQNRAVEVNSDKTNQGDSHLWPPVEDDTIEAFTVHEGSLRLERFEPIPTEQCMSLMLKSPMNSHTDVSSKNTGSYEQVRMGRGMNFGGATLTKDACHGQLRDTRCQVALQRPSASGSFHTVTNTNGKHKQTFSAVQRFQPQLSMSHLQPNPPHSLARAATSHVGWKAFSCEVCGKGFTQRMRLITHKRTHTGERPYCCQFCGKTFSRRDNCLRHVRLHNGRRL